MNKQSLFMRLLRGGWRALDGFRRLLHLFLLLFVLALLISVTSPEPVYVPESAALVVAPGGTIVDQLSGDPLDRALAELRGNAQREVLLRDLIEAINLGAADDRIKTLYLRLDALQSAGLSKLQELATAIDSFKASGKPVIASGAAFSRDQYYLAAFADEVFLHPMGVVMIEGYGRYIPYFKSALDALYIDYAAWTAGEYKSFTEPYTRDDMSDADREASRTYLDVLWKAYAQDVTAARGLSPVALDVLAENFVESLELADGNAARLAVNEGLVDELLTRREVAARLAEIAGSGPAEEGGYSGIDYAAYLSAARVADFIPPGGRKVAVVTLAGEILDGVRAPGTIGGDSSARLVRELRDDDDVRALVLRVDSPGGSAFASEVILEELRAFQDTGRPLVVSMGSVAASGGYWISMTADEIFASPTTITGSIGVGALAPTFPRALDQLGIHIDGIGTNALSGQFSQLRGLGETADAYFAASVEHLYGEFVSSVAEAREMSYADTDRVAQGRVWAGVHALDSGLVDQLGGLDAAIEAAAALAGLAAGDWHVDYVERQLSLSESIALQFASAAAPALRALEVELPWSDQIDAFVSQMLDPIEYLKLHNDPRGLYSYCFCDVR
jgi:protease-4